MRRDSSNSGKKVGSRCCDSGQGDDDDINPLHGRDQDPGKKASAAPRRYRRPLKIFHKTLTPLKMEAVTMGGVGLLATMAEGAGAAAAVVWGGGDGFSALGGGGGSDGGGLVTVSKGIAATAQGGLGVREDIAKRAATASIDFMAVINT